MEQSPYPNKSTRTFKEWLLSVKRIMSKFTDKEPFEVEVDQNKAKQSYEQGLMPSAFVNQVFNR